MATHPHSEQLLDTAGELSCRPDEQEISIDESEKWINFTDQGGLTHVTHKTFHLELGVYYNTFAKATIVTCNFFVTHHVMPDTNLVVA